MELQQIPIGQIRPYWNNPRHNDESVEAVKASITRYGFLQPLVLDKEHVIVVGHTRYKALMQLGWDKVPCFVADLTPAKAKEYRIADNKAGEGSTWNLDLLMTELRGVEDLKDIELFFPDTDLGSMLSLEGSPDLETGEASVNIAERSSQKFESAAQESLDVLKPVTCPHCGEDFEVNPKELLTARRS